MTGRLIYSTIASLDGFINDADGGYQWAAPGDDLVGYLNEDLADVSTYLYGRRMYEEMTVWETDAELAASSPESTAFAQAWQAADKVVFSRTLTEASTSRTRIESTFDADAVRKIKVHAAGDLTIDGPTIAERALRAGLVEEIQRYVVPAVVGGGTPLFPSDLRLDLDLVEQRPFDRGIVLLRYAVG